jgi:hypothetical protein
MLSTLKPATVIHDLHVPKIDPARWEADTKQWLGRLSLWHHSPWLLVLVVALVAGLLIPHIGWWHRGWRYLWAHLALVGVALVAYLSPVAGWAALGLLPLVVRRRRHWAHRLAESVLIWAAGLAVWAWSHPALLSRPAGGWGRDGEIAGLAAAGLAVAGLLVLVVRPRLGHRHQRWHQPNPDTRFASPEQRAQVIAAWGNRCAVCGAAGDAPGVALEIDHIVPYAQGGETDLSNFQPLCGPCNRAKGDMSMQDFMHTDYFRRAQRQARLAGAR